MVTLMIVVSAVASLLKVCAGGSGSRHAFPGNAIPVCFMRVMYLKGLAIRHTIKKEEQFGAKD